MTISEVLKKYSRIEVELLLSHLLSKPKEFLFLHPKYKLPGNKLKKLLSLIKRRLSGEPMAYILGYKYFYGLKFKVNKHVLIPRPETEWLVDAIKSNPSSVLDLGTGSGAIIISLAKKFKSNKTQYYGSDISTKALQVAKTNAKNFGVKIKFFRSDLFNNIPGKFDVIIANLPYVPVKDYKKLFKNLKYEPKSAITDGSDTFKIYHKFFQQLSKNGALSSPTTLYIEIDPAARKHIIIWTKKYLPEWKVKFYKDYNKLWRFAKISV